MSLLPSDKISGRHGFWIQELLQAVQVEKKDYSVIIKVDNMGCISISKNDVINERNKHTDDKYQIIADHVKKDDVVWSTETHEITVDMLLPIPRHLHLVSKLGMRD